MTQATKKTPTPETKVSMLKVQLVLATMVLAMSTSGCLALDLARCCFSCTTGISVYEESDFEKGIQEITPKLKVKTPKLLQKTESVRF